MNFSGMGAVYPGYLDAMKAEGAGRMAQTSADAGEIDFQGREALGRAIFQASMPGAQAMPGTPAGGPMPPPPGQASVPATPPGGGGGGGMPGQAGMAQPPTQSAPPSASAPAGVPQLDLQTVISRIQAANPGIKPAVLMSALERAQPILSQQAKQELMMMRLEFQQSSLEQRGQIAQQSAEIRRLAEERRTAQGDRRLGQGDDRIALARANQLRLKENAGIRNDAALQRLKLQREDMERKVRQGDSRASLAQWRAALDAEHKRTMEIISTHTAGGIGVPASEKQALIDAANQMRDDAIARMQALREGRPGGVPGAGSEPLQAEAPPAVAPAAVAPAAPSAAPAGTPPAPVATTGNEPTATNPQTGERLIFRNGQWVPLQ